MLYPYTLPPACVFDKEELKKKCECMCGKQSNMTGDKKLVTWTHKVGDDNWGWFLACEPHCLITHVSAGSA